MAHDGRDRSHALPPRQVPRSQQDRQDYGADLGGYMMKDHLWFFGAYNRVTDNHVVGSGLENDTGILTSDGTSTCSDNYLRNQTPTVNCNASMGNE